MNTEANLKTPRTDAATFDLKGTWACGLVVSQEVSSQLERELADALKALEELLSDYERMVGDGLTESNAPSLVRQARRVLGRKGS